MSAAARVLGFLVAADLIHPPVAHAHTLGNRHVSQLLEIELRATGVVIRLTVDAPPEQWADFGGAADPAQGSLDRLRQGLMVVVDDTTLPIRVLEARPIWDLASGASTLEIAVAADADLRGRHTVRVGNANLQETPNYLNDELTVPPGAVVHATSLLRKTATGAIADRSGVWAQYEALRSVSVEATLPDDPWSAAFARLHGGVWRLDDARERPLAQSWRAGRDTPATVLLAALTAGLLSAAASRLWAAYGTRGLAAVVPAALWAVVACGPNLRPAVIGVALCALPLGWLSTRLPARPAGVVVYGAGAVAAVVAAARLIG